MTFRKPQFTTTLHRLDCPAFENFLNDIVQSGLHWLSAFQVCPPLFTDLQVQLRFALKLQLRSFVLCFKCEALPFRSKTGAALPARYSGCPRLIVWLFPSVCSLHQYQLQLHLFGILGWFVLMIRPTAEHWVSIKRHILLTVDYCWITTPSFLHSISWA